MIGKWKRADVTTTDIHGVTTSKERKHALLTVRRSISVDIFLCCRQVTCFDLRSGLFFSPTDRTLAHCNKYRSHYSTFCSHRTTYPNALRDDVFKVIDEECASLL